MLELFRGMTTGDVARHLNVAWDLVKDIQKRDLAMKRTAYGFRDREFFKLKIRAIDESKYALVG